MADFLYLLDTNIVSDLVRHPAGRVRTRVVEAGEKRVPGLAVESWLDTTNSASASP